jgi:glutamate 5-kinase
VRTDLSAARRLVVKIGSSTLAGPAGGLAVGRVDALAAALAERRRGGAEVLLVSSGAIAAGLAPLRLRGRPRDLATLQAAASVGQGMLVERYAAAFARHGVTVGQVLLTADDVIRRAHYRNAQRTLERLLELGVVPIVNENDTVATDEIRFGDNDRLAAITAQLVRADALVLLSDVDGVYDDDPRRPGARLLPAATAEDLAAVTAGRAGSAVGTGGMATKIEAARLASAAGIAVVVAHADAVVDALAGAAVGTYVAAGRRRVASRLLWLAHATVPRGRLVLDDGAVRAVVERRLSLLPAGVVAVEGTFEAGDPVDLVGLHGQVVGRGIVEYASTELPDLLGRSTRELAEALGPSYEREVVHRDDLALL